MRILLLPRRVRWQLCLFWLVLLSASGAITLAVLRLAWRALTQD